MDVVQVIDGALIQLTNVETFLLLSMFCHACKVSIGSTILSVVLEIVFNPVLLNLP